MPPYKSLAGGVRWTWSGQRMRLRSSRPWRTRPFGTMVYPLGCHPRPVSPRSGSCVPSLVTPWFRRFGSEAISGPWSGGSAIVALTGATWRFGSCSRRHSRIFVRFKRPRTRHGTDYSGIGRAECPITCSRSSAVGCARDGAQRSFDTKTLPAVSMTHNLRSASVPPGRPRASSTIQASVPS